MKSPSNQAWLVAAALIGGLGIPAALVTSIPKRPAISIPPAMTTRQSNSIEAIRARRAEFMAGPPIAQPATKAAVATQPPAQSAEKQEWLRLKNLCDENMARRDAGFMGRLEPYCLRAEELRERATGIELSTSPGASNF